MIRKHRFYFENIKGVDVAFSAKGEYFFYEYNEGYSDYPTFVKFSDAKELEQIIEENIATEHCVNLQNLLEETLHVLDGPGRQEIDVVDVAENYSDMDRRALINTFAAFSSVIERVHETLQPFKKWVGDMDKVSAMKSEE